MKNIPSPLMGEEDDPEYGLPDQNFHEESRALSSLQQLACELSALRASQAAVSAALERVCEHVMRDPVYSESTRAAFRPTLEILKSASR